LDEIFPPLRLSFAARDAITRHNQRLALC
jgi:hypothetical protein